MVDMSYVLRILAGLATMDDFAYVLRILGALAIYVGALIIGSLVWWGFDGLLRMLRLASWLRDVLWLVYLAYIVVASLVILPIVNLAFTCKGVVC